MVVRAGRTTDRVKIVLADPQKSSRDPKGAGSLAVTLEERNKAVLIALVPSGSEASYAGVEPGDTLLAVNGKEVHAMDAARKLLTGPLGEDVILDLAREGVAEKSIRLRVRRERVRR